MTASASGFAPWWWRIAEKAAYGEGGVAVMVECWPRVDGGGGTRRGGREVRR